MQELQRDARGDAVRVLQFCLGLKADGNFGPITEAELKAKYGVTVCDATTWARIAAVLPTVPDKADRNAISALQVLLGLAVSGVFGVLTRAALKRVQAHAPGLTVTERCGPQTWRYMLTDYVPPFAAVKPTDYKQYDKRWAKNPFGKAGDTIRGSGCGATAMANVLAFRIDSAITPATVTEMENKQGFATAHNGTARAFFDWVAKKYGFAKYKRTYSTDEAIGALQRGALVVALMGPGYWTGGGHYICCWKYDPATDRIYANDPASATRKSAISDVFRKQRKEYFIFE